MIEVLFSPDRFKPRFKPRFILARLVLTSAACLALAVPGLGTEPLWRSPSRYRLLLKVDCRGVSRSNSPAAVDLDFV